MAKMTFSLSLSRVCLCVRRRNQDTRTLLSIQDPGLTAAAHAFLLLVPKTERERERERKPAEGNFSNASEPEVGNGLSSFPMEEVILGFRGLA